jgi:hypothetical protein
MVGTAQLLESLAALTYWQAGCCVGLLQGYAYAAAETCHVLGLTDAEQQFRRLLPRPQVSTTLV